LGKLICGKCGIPLTEQKTIFQYMGYEVYENLPRCPVCGQVYLDEKLVRGRMAEVETEVEDK